MKRGDLLTYGAYHVIFLGAERLREKFDVEGHGGLFVPQIKVVIASNSPSYAAAHTCVGKQMWVDSKLVKRAYSK